MASATSRSSRAPSSAARRVQKKLRRTRETVAFNVASVPGADLSGRSSCACSAREPGGRGAAERQIQTFVDNGAHDRGPLPAAGQRGQRPVRGAGSGAPVELAKVDLIQTMQLDPTGNYEFQAPEDSTAAAAAQQLAASGPLQMRAADPAHRPQGGAGAPGRRGPEREGGSLESLAHAFAQRGVQLRPTTAIPAELQRTAGRSPRGLGRAGSVGAALRSLGDEQRHPPRRDPGGQRAPQSGNLAAGRCASGPPGACWISSPRRSSSSSRRHRRAPRSRHFRLRRIATPPALRRWWRRRRRAPLRCRRRAALVTARFNLQFQRTLIGLLRRAISTRVKLALSAR